MIILLFVSATRHQGIKNFNFTIQTSQNINIQFKGDMDVIFRGKKTELKELADNPFINHQDLHIDTVRRRIKKYCDTERAFNEPKHSTENIVYGNIEIKRSIKCLPSDVQKSMISGDVNEFLLSCKKNGIGEERAYK